VIALCNVIRMYVCRIERSLVQWCSANQPVVLIVIRTEETEIWQEEEFCVEICKKCIVKFPVLAGCN
jgi:hypothetical protein